MLTQEETDKLYRFAAMALTLCGFVIGLQLYPGDALWVILTPALVGFFGYIILKCIDNDMLTTYVSLLCALYFVFVGIYVTSCTDYKNRQPPL